MAERDGSWWRTMAGLQHHVLKPLEFWLPGVDHSEMFNILIFISHPWCSSCPRVVSYLFVCSYCIEYSLPLSVHMGLRVINYTVRLGLEILHPNDRSFRTEHPSLTQGAWSVHLARSWRTCTWTTIQISVKLPSICHQLIIQEASIKINERNHGYLCIFLALSSLFVCLGRSCSLVCLFSFVTCSRGCQIIGNIRAIIINKGTLRNQWFHYFDANGSQAL